MSIPSHELAHIITTRSTALLIKCAYLQLREKKGGRVQFELMEINLNFKKKTRQYNIEEKYHPRSSLKSSLHLFLSTDNLLRRFKTPLSPPPHPFPRNELFPQYQHSISNIARANDINDVIIGEKRDDTFNDVTIIIDASSLSLPPFLPLPPSSPSLAIPLSTPQAILEESRERINKPGLPRNHPHKVRFIYRKSMARRISPARLLYNAAQLMPNCWPDLFLNSGKTPRPHRDNRRSVYGYAQPVAERGERE